MNFYELLYAGKNSGALSATYYELLFAKYLNPAGAEWAEYDGTLPAQYSANGSTLADYRIYGAAGGVGDDSGTEYGYVVPMSVSDGTTSTTTQIHIGDTPLEAIGNCADYIDYQSGKIVRQITQKIVLSGQENFNIDPSTSVFTYDSALPAVARDDVLNPSIASNAYSGYKSVGVYGLLPDKSICVRSYYKQIWIRDTDYTTVADFKAYLAERYALGNPVVMWYVRDTFINEDPPVSLPALPTVDGTNIVDYAGQSAAVPSRFYAKYRKG